MGVFVLDKIFEEAWGAEAAVKKRDFNAYLEVVYCIKRHVDTLLELSFMSSSYFF